jgi:putative aldouronate transport system permease protein
MSNLKKQMPLHLMLLPGMIALALFCYYPMCGIILAFKDYIPSKGIWSSPWVGFEHFSFMFTYSQTWRAIINTVIISLLKIVLTFPIPIIFSLMLNEVYQKTIKRTVQTAIYLPYFVSWVILGGIFVDLLSKSGMINQVFHLFGFAQIDFLSDNRYFRLVLIVTEIWKNSGYGTVVYLAALTGVDPALYEASYVDGAGRWKQTLYITIPSIMPIVAMTAILNLGNILNAGFDQIYILSNPTVYETADIIDTLVYRLTVQSPDFGLATAVGLLKSAVTCVFMMSGYYILYKTSDYRIF